MTQFLKQHFEVVIWISALAFLAFVDPFSQQHFCLCPLYNLGFDFCPGCGLGRSIAHILHGNVHASFNTHILGIPALLVLLHRIGQLLFSRRSINRNTSGTISLTHNEVKIAINLETTQNTIHQKDI